MTPATKAKLAPIEIEDRALDSPGALGLLLYLLLGTFFGIVLIKSEVVSWYRIQEMFRFDSFHMYGVLGSAFATAALSLAVLRRPGMRTMIGTPINVPRKELGGGYRYGLGGTTFGVGWALTGACPGPIVALIGFGVSPFLAVLVATLLGTWTYAHVRQSLPH